MQLWKKILLMLSIILLVCGLVVTLVMVVPKSNDIKCENIHLKVSDYDNFQFISERDVE